LNRRVSGYLETPEYVNCRKGCWFSGNPISYHRQVISFPPVPAGDAIKISATTYLSFRQCPAQAEARLHGIYSAESKASFTGALAHRLFARHLNTGPIEDVNQAIREEIGAGLNTKMAAIGIHRPSELTEMIRHATALYDRFRLFPAEGFEAAEITLEVEPSEGVKLIGKIDAVFREEQPGPVLRDWKTGSLGEPIEQLMFYALVWALEKREMVAAVEAVSLQTGERMRQTPSVGELTMVARHIADLVTAVRTSWSSGDGAAEVRTERRGGPWCRYCPLLEDCPEGRAADAVNR